MDYLKGIKEGYLGRNWQFDIGEAYKAQYFRQPGHEKELPKSFIARCIMYTRMLAKSDDGGPLEVHLVMARAPLAWRTILVLENIKSSSMLYTKAAEHEASLLDISRNREATNVITSENLVSTLCKMGYTLDRAKFNNFPQNRRVNLMFNEEEESLPVEDPRESFVTQTIAQETHPKDDEILAEVFQVLKKRQRPPPPGGSMFSKNDHVTTKMGRLPPSPCKCCGSSNHWDKECPDWAVYLERSSKSSYGNEVEREREDEYYQSAYSILLSQCVASLQVDQTKLEKDFKSAVCSGMSDQSYHRHKTGVSLDKTTVSMEEIEDEFWEEHRNRPKNYSHILQSVDDFDASPKESEESNLALSNHPPERLPRSRVLTNDRAHERRVLIEEVEDEDLIAARIKPTSPKHILISTEELDDLEDSNSATQLDKEREAHQTTQQPETENILP